MEWQDTQQIYENIKAQNHKNVWVLPHTCRAIYLERTLEIINSTLLKKRKEKKSSSQEDIWPAYRQKTHNQQNKNHNIHIQDWCSLHLIFSHLNSCYQVHNLSLAGYYPKRYIYPNPNRNFLTIRIQSIFKKFWLYDSTFFEVSNFIW